MVPEQLAPRVLSVTPSPSVPLCRGVDVVLTLRFSEAPRGSVEEGDAGRRVGDRVIDHMNKKASFKSIYIYMFVYMY